MSFSDYIYCIESNFISAFEPFDVLIARFLWRVYWNQHSLTEEWSFFNKVNNIESSSAFLTISKPEKKPIVVSVGVYIVFD